jgi:GNAT superfamily N-acetyltransferase
MLLEKAVEIARDVGCSQIMLTSEYTMESTLSFFRKAGFSDSETAAFVIKL